MSACTGTVTHQDQVFYNTGLVEAILCNINFTNYYTNYYGQFPGDDGNVDGNNDDMCEIYAGAGTYTRTASGNTKWEKVSN
jgi:hypothetical protein